MERSGGAQAFSKSVYRVVNTKLKAILCAWAGGILIFFSIQYGKDKKVKTITIAGSKNTSKVIKKLSKKKKYTVRIRTYRKINNKKYYSAWSKKKTVVTRK